MWMYMTHMCDLYTVQSQVGSSNAVSGYLDQYTNSGHVLKVLYCDYHIQDGNNAHNTETLELKLEEAPAAMTAILAQQQQKKIDILKCLK